MPDGDILDFLKTFQDQPYVIRIDSIGTTTNDRAIGEFLHPTGAAISLPPVSIEKNPASLIRESEFPDLLDLLQCQVQN